MSVSGKVGRSNEFDTLVSSWVADGRVVSFESRSCQGRPSVLLLSVLLPMCSVVRRRTEKQLSPFYPLLLVVRVRPDSGRAWPVGDLPPTLYSWPARSGATPARDSQTTQPHVCVRH